jgi:hypothetical protein
MRFQPRAFSSSHLRLVGVCFVTENFDQDEPSRTKSTTTPRGNKNNAAAKTETLQSFNEPVVMKSFKNAPNTELTKAASNVQLTKSSKSSPTLPRE